MRGKMDTAILDIMCCPACGGHELRLFLAEGVPHLRGERITCQSCGKYYQVINGIADFLVEPPTEVVREKEAFRAFRPGEPSTPEEWEEHRRTVLSLPMLEGCSLPASDLKTWRRHGREAFGICEGLEWRGRRVLELGAGRCWFSAYLARQGAQVVAVDILEDEVMGLGCGRFFEEEQGIRLHRVLCDMHRLPFRDGAFDAVTATATLHHSPDLPALLGEVRRVLRPGGLLLAANEPLYVPWRETPEEERRGAHEGHYPLWAWIRFLRRSGFRLAEVRAAEGGVASLAFRAVKDGRPTRMVPGLAPGTFRYLLVLALSPLRALRRKTRSAIAGRPMLPLPGEKRAYLRARVSAAGLGEEARVGNPAHWGPGWYPPEQPLGQERPFRWAGPRSRLLLPSPRGAGSLVLELATFHPSPWSRPVEVEVKWGRKKLGKARLERHGWQKLRFPAPSAASGRVCPLTLVVRSGYFRPSEEGAGGDMRLLGVACRAARWE
ncbi:MAG: methyltransferase domain-containing protein [Actinomycetota bacterium]